LILCKYLNSSKGNKYFRNKCRDSLIKHIEKTKKRIGKIRKSKIADKVTKRTTEKVLTITRTLSKRKNEQNLE
jgi:hypothetical protein